MYHEPFNAEADETAWVQLGHMTGSNYSTGWSPEASSVGTSFPWASFNVTWDLLARPFDNSTPPIQATLCRSPCTNWCVDGRAGGRAGGRARVPPASRACSLTGVVLRAFVARACPAAGAVCRGA